MSKNGRFFLGALFGASIAGIAALLYAPKPGKELRQDIAKEIDNLIDQAEEYRDYAVERGVEFYDIATEAKDDIKVNLKESAQHFKTQFDDVRQEAAEEWHHVQDELRHSKENLEESVGDLMDEAKRTGNEIKAEAKDVSEIVKEEAHDLSEDIQFTGEMLKDSAQDSVNNIKEETQQN